VEVVTRRLVTVVGLGPADESYLSPRTVALLHGGNAVLRTRVHPAAEAFSHLESYDSLYEQAETFAEVYSAIVEDLVERASSGPVVYGVPGSPLVAEHTVELLRRDERVELHVEPTLSFLDLAWAKLGIDPVAEAVTMIDATELLSRRDLGGPLLIAQTWNGLLLSELKLQADELMGEAPTEAVILHHLGLEDEVVATVAWEDLDRTVEADHLTSVYVATWPSAGAALSSLQLIIEQLRRECPWDMEQTHQSLGRHLLEESYEVLDAIEALAEDEDATSDVEEELGDLLVQVLFHGVLGSETGAFGFPSIAKRVEDKLVFRHPHVFADTVAETKEDVAANWEVLKKKEKGRESITDGIPVALPALALVAKLQRKAQAAGVLATDAESQAQQAAEALVALTASVQGATSLEGAMPNSSAVGDLLQAVVSLAQFAGIDPEAALRAKAVALRTAIRIAEGVDSVG